MTKEEYLQFHKTMCGAMVGITERKNADYTGTSNDPFGNFRKHGELGFLVRMHDKMARIESFVAKGFLEVKDESVFDTLLDLANYSILLAGFIKERMNERKEEKEGNEKGTTCEDLSR